MIMTAGYRKTITLSITERETISGTPCIRYSLTVMNGWLSVIDPLPRHPRPDCHLNRYLLVTRMLLPSAAHFRNRKPVS